MAQSLFNQQTSLYLQKVNLLYQRPEIKASLEIILSVFTVTLLIFFAIRPTITNIFTLQKKITDQEVLLKKADNKISQLTNSQKQIADNISNIPLLQAAVPNTFDYFGYAKRMQVLAQKHNITLDFINFPGEIISGNNDTKLIPKEKIKNYMAPDKDGLFTIKTMFSISGSQSGVLGFISDIENMDRLALLDSIDISKNQKGSDNAKTLNVSGQVIFYSLSNKK